jgi:Domain of unknown function (DUF4189)
MGRVLFAIALYLAATASALGYGSVAAGNDGSSYVFSASANHRTAEEAEAAALHDCSSRGLQDCGALLTFQDICLAVGLNGSYLYHLGEGPTPLQARQKMTSLCEASQMTCTWVLTACDGTPATDTVPAAAARTEAPAQAPENSAQTANAPMAGLMSFLAWLTRFHQVWSTLAFFTGAILFVAMLRLCISIVSTTPTTLLKQQSLVCAWLVVPATIAFAFWLLPPSFLYPFFPFFSYFGFLAFLAWTSAFGALIIGRHLRQRFSKNWKAPAPLSLPLAGFAFGSVAILLLILYWFYGGISFSSCGLPSHPLLSLCGVVQRQGVFWTSALLLLIAVCGGVLPPDSNLVIANHRFGSFLRKSVAAIRPKKRKQPASTEQQPAPAEGSYPVPALYSAPAVDAMRLKLKRSQRASVFGKIVFVLDARMELTADEFDLLRKYRLGNDVVYESSSRQRRREATQAHLEMTKGGPGLTDSAGAQMMGVAKTLFWFGRASISATAASLSLRITIHSLISGVHVECKSMSELLEAETAIREAADGLRAYLNVAATFDGREEIVELK